MMSTDLRGLTLGQMDQCAGRAGGRGQGAGGRGRGQGAGGRGQGALGAEIPFSVPII